MVNLKGPSAKLIIFSKAHLFEILSVEFSLPLKGSVSDFIGAVRIPYQTVHWVQAGHRPCSWTRVTLICTVSPAGHSGVVWVILSELGYITCFPRASSPCLLGYLCLCFSGFCTHSSPATELPVLGAVDFPRMLFWSVINSTSWLAGSRRNLQVAVMCNEVLQLVLRSQLTLIPAGVRKVVSNEEVLVFLCEVWRDRLGQAKMILQTESAEAAFLPIS